MTSSCDGEVKHATPTKSGFLYAVARQGDLTAVKIGYTCAKDPWAYCRAYNRTMVPVEILQLLPTSNAPLAEKMAHHFLMSKRVSMQHEVFDMHICANRLQDCFRHIEAFDIMSGQPRPHLLQDKPPESKKKHKLSQCVEGTNIKQIRRKVKAKLTEEQVVAQIEAQERAKQQHKEAVREQQQKQAAFQQEESVRDFLNHVMQQGHAEDFVSAKQLIRKYHDLTGSKANNKWFKETVNGIVPPSNFRTKHDFVNQEGRRTSASCVYMGYTLYVS